MVDLFKRKEAADEAEYHGPVLDNAKDIGRTLVSVFKRKENEEAADEAEYHGPALHIVEGIGRTLDEWDWQPDEPRWEDIKGRCEQALELDPRCFPALVWLGHYHFERREYGRMEEYFIRAIDATDDPYNEHTTDGIEMWLHEGMISKEGKRDEEMTARVMARYHAKRLEALERRYDGRPDAESLKELVYQLWLMERRTEALQLVEGYVLKNPQDRKAAKLQKKMAAWKKDRPPVW